MFGKMSSDVQAVFDNDPAARGKLEVILTYPGLHAIWFQRISHFFYKKQAFTIARIISHLSRFLTGIEIHPGATIGDKVFIDHGMGIVIGETAEVGDGCLLYKGVVLGGTSLAKKKRHPTLGKGVVVGSNACVLGDIKIGDCARIGSGSVVINSVPDNATVVGIPGKIVRRQSTEFDDKLQHADLPDPLIETLGAWMNLLKKYEKRIAKLEDHHDIESESLTDEFKKELPFLLADADKCEKKK